MSFEAEASLLQRARGIVAKPEFFFIFAIAFGLSTAGLMAAFMSSAVTGTDAQHNTVITTINPIVLVVELSVLGVGIALQVMRELGGKALVLGIALVALLSGITALWVESLAPDAHSLVEFGGIDMLISFAVVALVGLGWAARNIMVIFVGLFAGLAGIIAITAAILSGPLAGGLVTAGALCIVAFFMFSRA